MAEYLAPGVYVEEVERGAAPLEGVSTSTAGFLGPTERGPTGPRLLTSYADFERTYGGRLDDSHLASAVDGFFANGGSRCYVGRITADGDDTAAGNVPVESDREPPLLVADPGRVEFGAVGQTDTETATVTLTHDGDDDDPDVDVTLDDDATLETTMSEVGFSYGWDDGTASGDTVTLQSGDERDVEFTFEPDTVSSAGDVWRHWARFEVDPGGDVDPVGVTLEGYNGDASAAERLATGSELDFGVVDDTSTASLTVENDSGTTLAVDADASEVYGPDAGEFSLDATGQEDVADGDSGSFDVEFAPGADAGSRAATLLLAHDGDNSPLVVDLRGWNGVAMEAEAVGPGEWGGHVALVVEDASMYEPGRNDLFKLTVRYWTDDDDVVAAEAGGADPDADGVPDPDVEEVFDDLSPDETSSKYYVKQVNDASMLVDLVEPGDARPSTDAGPTWLDDPGADGSISAGDYEGDATLPPEERTGFAGFEKVDDISIVCVPDEHTHGGEQLTDAVVQHCVEMDDRFAVLQAEQNPGPTADLRPPHDTDMAAFYYPWLEVTDPDTGMVEEIPPGGHVAGIYARSDANRGVHKAPANEVVRGIQGLQRTITKGEQEVLNPRGVNCIRGFRGRGIRVWGARTASSDPNWKYVNVRRLFLFLRESIEEGTQWVVFEPNDEQLWARVRQTISNFLTDVWDDGALMGTSPEEAFFVKCDRSTMTQSDIENGRLICEIGVAPVRPAEFVVFRIAQWTASAE